MKGGKSVLESDHDFSGFPVKFRFLFHEDLLANSDLSDIQMSYVLDVSLDVLHQLVFALVVLVQNALVYSIHSVLFPNPELLFSYHHQGN